MSLWAFERKMLVTYLPVEGIGLINLMEKIFFIFLCPIPIYNSGKMKKTELGMEAQNEAFLFYCWVVHWVCSYCFGNRKMKPFKRGLWEKIKGLFTFLASLLVTLLYDGLRHFGLTVALQNEFWSDWLLCFLTFSFLNNMIYLSWKDLIYEF